MDDEEEVNGAKAAQQGTSSQKDTSPPVGGGLATVRQLAEKCGLTRTINQKLRTEKVRVMEPASVEFVSSKMADVEVAASTPIAKRPVDKKIRSFRKTLENVPEVSATPPKYRGPVKSRIGRKQPAKKIGKTVITRGKPAQTHGPQRKNTTNKKAQGTPRTPDARGIIAARQAKPGKTTMRLD